MAPACCKNNTCRNRKPILPLVPPEDENKKHIECIKHARSETASGVTETIEERIPTIGDETTARELLNFFDNFRQTCRNLSWTTGPKFFQKFQAHLSGIQADNWDTIIQGQNQTVANFNTLIAEFKSITLAGCNYHDQMDYLQTRHLLNSLL